MLIIYLSILLISSFIFYKVGYKLCYKKNKDRIEFFSKEKGGRYGTIRVTGAGYSPNTGTVEFREIARSDSQKDYNGTIKTWIKIEIIDVYPDSGKSKQKVLDELSYDGWIKDTSDKYYITWYEDNSQRIRDERINEILK